MKSGKFTKNFYKLGLFDQNCLFPVEFYWTFDFLLKLININSLLRIRIQGVKYQPKTAKKPFLLLKPKSEFLKKERL